MTDLPRRGPKAPALSLVLCSRNDQYMGNSRWRLQTALNHVAQHVHALGRLDDVEVLVTDWGSQAPLREVLELEVCAAELVRFFLVPRALASQLQKDSPFPEVIALNVAARRARGDYIGRIDQDTLVGRRFLEAFFDLIEGRRQLDAPLDAALLFSGHRHIPYRLAARCPDPWLLARYLERRGTTLPVSGGDTPSPFYLKPVGIWLLHRRLWQECGGYDERMIYMNGMEANMMHRLMAKYPMVDLGGLVGHDFHHLEHYHPLAVRKPAAHRKVNPHLPFWEPDRMNPNGEGWGLAAHSLTCVPSSAGTGVGSSAMQSPAFAGTRYLLFLTRVDAHRFCDRIVIAMRIWQNRAQAAWRIVRGEPLLSWPRLLHGLWIARRAARRG